MDPASPAACSEAQLLMDVATLARRFAGKYMCTHDAEDLAQDVVLECLIRMRAGKWKPIISLGAFVRAMVWRRRTDSLRQRERRTSRDAEHARALTESVHTWMSPEHALEERELLSFHEQTLTSLPRSCRRAYVMVREEEAPYQLVADRLGVSRATVCAHVVAAQRRFRLELLEQGIATRARSPNSSIREADPTTRSGIGHRRPGERE